MYLSDTKIQELIDSEVLLHADASNIGQVTYDLRTDGFYINENKQSEVELGLVIRHSSLALNVLRCQTI